MGISIGTDGDLRRTCGQEMRLLVRPLPVFFSLPPGVKKSLVIKSIIFPISTARYRHSKITGPLGGGMPLLTIAGRCLPRTTRLGDLDQNISPLEVRQHPQAGYRDTW